MSSKIRVCFVSYWFSPIYSGRAMFIQKLIRELRKSGIMVCVLTARLKKLPKYEFIDGAHVYRVPVTECGGLAIRRTSFAFSCLLFILFKGWRYNIIHLSTIWFAPILFKLAGKKTIYDMTQFGSDDPTSVRLNYGRFGLTLYAFADHFICPSTALCNSYNLSKLPQHKISQIPRGIDPDIFHPVEPDQKNILRQKLALPSNTKLVVSVVEIVKRKGIDFLIDVWIRVLQEYENAMLLLVGPFNDADFLLEMKQKIQLGQSMDKVRLVGEVDNVVDYLQASDVFAFCSVREGLPNALIEAASCGLPCVVLNIEGITEDIISNRVDGIIVKERNVCEYAKNMLKVLQNDDFARQLGINARRKVISKFSISNVCTQYTELYKKLFS